MKSNFFKSTLLTLAFLCQIGALSIAGNSSADVYTGGGTIIVEGDNLISTSDDSEDSILHITMISDNGRVYDFTGCGDDICVDDINNVPKGNYDVVVISTSGGFDGGVYVK
jgi:hypothetical protein